MSEPFSKISSISDEFKYSNIWLKLPLNIIRICICAISGIWIYSDVYSVNMWHPNIFGYSFYHHVASKYIWIFVFVHFMIFSHHWYIFFCIWCFYLHISRDLESPVCQIFHYRHILLIVLQCIYVHFSSCIFITLHLYMLPVL